MDSSLVNTFYDHQNVFNVDAKWNVLTVEQKSGNPAENYRIKVIEWKDQMH